jgi:hypothetical protein
MAKGPEIPQTPFSQTQGIGSVNLAPQKPSFSPLQQRGFGASSGGGRIPAKSFAMTQASSPMMSGAPSGSGGQMSAILKMLQDAQ